MRNILKNVPKEHLWEPPQESHKEPLGKFNIEPLQENPEKSSEKPPEVQPDKLPEKPHKEPPENPLRNLFKNLLQAKRLLLEPLEFNTRPAAGLRSQVPLPHSRCSDCVCLVSNLEIYKNNCVYISTSITNKYCVSIVTGNLHSDFPSETTKPGFAN